MDCFERERELSILFKRRNEAPDIRIDYSISNKSVDIIVFHKPGNWDIEQGRKYLNRLWKNYNLAFIGHKTHCTVLNYSNINNGRPITEYMFPMLKFNIENYHSPEFVKYRPDY